jgi:hypothetical protein
MPAAEIFRGGSTPNQNTAEQKGVYDFVSVRRLPDPEGMVEVEMVEAGAAG